MDWESLHGNLAQYEERLREIERENYARRIWASTHPAQDWWGLGRRIGQQVTNAVAAVRARYGAHFGKLSSALPGQDSQAVSRK